jgi:lipopolysaccharide biosynthesis glycosyltransferase
VIELLTDFRRAAAGLNLANPLVVCAADDNYVKPLAVTLLSAGQNLGPGRRLTAIVLDGGISDGSWMGLKESLVDARIDLYSIRPQERELAALPDLRQLPISHHITHTAYLRLLAGRLLPDSIDKAIYLDSDLLVRGNLDELWQVPLDQQYALAVPDIACPFVDARLANCNFAKASPYFAALSPIANWRDLGLDPTAPYFNSGVMVLNIRRMREERLENRLFHVLRSNAKHIWCWDQYALNVVFASAWTPLPLRWNQGAHIFDFPDESCSPLGRQQFLDARDDPAIIHYTTEWKPWDFRNRHPARELFFKQLDQTVWRGWRPKRPVLSLSGTWNSFAAETAKRSVIATRKLVNWWQRDAAAPNTERWPTLNSNGKSSSIVEQQIQSDRGRDGKLVTFFAIPRPFEGEADIAQRNAIQSWKRFADCAEVVLLGDVQIQRVASELGVGYIGKPATNSRGTPLVSSAFALAASQCQTPYLIYSNCDMIFFDDLIRAIKRLLADSRLDSFLAIGRRTDLQVRRLIDFGSQDELVELRRLARESGSPESLVCKDFFVFPKGLFSDVPGFAIGRGNWDNWIVHHAKRLGVPVVSVSDCVLAVHQQHGYLHSGGRWKGYVTGVEARDNQRLAGGRHLISGSTSDFRLDYRGLKAVRGGYLASEFWLDFPNFARLLAKFVGGGASRRLT